MESLDQFSLPLHGNRSSARIPRRQFLQLTAATAGGLVAAEAGAHAQRVLGQPGLTGFLHGVASGDPLPDRVIIWTRVTPTPDAAPGSGLGRPVNVLWEVALDPAFRRRVALGRAFTGPAWDHTVKVDVLGLRPGTSYYYRFSLRNTGPFSPVGLTRTAPAVGAPVSSLRFGVCSCSNYEGGFFSAYRHLAARDDLDFILHLGDYIYEYGPGAYGPGASIGRVHQPAREIVTLADYRQRHAQYKADPDLQALHARYPFITTWDDHELTNDTWDGGAENHQPDEGDFFERRANAYRAYFEWMPLRLPEPTEQPTRIYRRFEFGALADLSMLDLRQYRDQQPASGVDPSRDDGERTIIGREQLDWLEANLEASAQQWKLVGNSVMIAPVDFRNPFIPPEVLARLGLMMGVPFNVDSLDGYTDDRRELLAFLGGINPTAAAINNVVFLTGDIHSSWACDLPLDPVAYLLQGQPSVAVELVGTSITSDNLNEIFGVPPRSPLSLQVEGLFKAANPHVRLLEFDSHGYSVVDLTPQRLQMDWHYISDRALAGATSAFASAMQVAAGTNRVVPAAGPLGPRV